MSGGVIKAGNGANRQHQIILLGGVYDITGGTGLNASTELVAMADGLTGATAAELKADAGARKGAGWLALRTSNASAGWDGWIQRGATDITGSKFRNITSAKVVGGDCNWIDTSEFRGGSASTAAPAARPSSSATPTSATSLARPATTPSASPRAPNLTVTNGRLTFAASGGQTLVSTFTNVNDFAITVRTMAASSTPPVSPASPPRPISAT